MESTEEKREDKSAEKLELEIMEKILLKDNVGVILQDLLKNTMLSENNKFSPGMKYEDFDITFSSFEAVNKEILHTLIIVPNRYDQNSKFCQFPRKEEVKFIEEKYDGYNKTIKNYYRSFKIMLTPRIRRNLKFDIRQFKYRTFVDGKPVDYIMNHTLKDKDLLCIVTHKLKLKLKDPNKPHKYGKITQILEQLQDKNDEKLKKFWDYFEIVYIIFCIRTEKKMVEEYAKFPPEMQNVDKNFKNVKLLFYVEEELHKKNKENPKIKLRNMWVYNNFGKNYFFLMNKDHQIYKADNMLFSGDIVEESAQFKENEKLVKAKSPEEQKELIRQRYKAFLDFYDFYGSLVRFKYALYFGCEFEICLKFNEKKNAFYISYIDFYKLAADLRPPEVHYVKKLCQILKPEDVEDVREIEITDIPVDFKETKCKVCKKEIQKDEPMYYCYKCETKDKYCQECVMKNFKEQKSNKKKFIDPKHNLLFFKTRNPEHFKVIDKFKLGEDIFTKVTDDNQFETYQRLCTGCKRKFNESPRYICVSCNKGTLIYGRFHEFCIDCMNHMMKGDEEGKKIEAVTERIYGYETRVLLTNNELTHHVNDEHVYIMIAMEVKDKIDF